MELEREEKWKRRRRRKGRKRAEGAFPASRFYLLQRGQPLQPLPIGPRPHLPFSIDRIRPSLGSILSSPSSRREAADDVSTLWTHGDARPCPQSPSSSLRYSFAYEYVYLYLYGNLRYPIVTVGSRDHGTVLASEPIMSVDLCGNLLYSYSSFSRCRVIHKRHDRIDDGYCSLIILLQCAKFRSCDHDRCFKTSRVGMRLNPLNASSVRRRSAGYL